MRKTYKLNAIDLVFSCTRARVQPHFYLNLVYSDFFSTHLLFNDRTYQVAGWLAGCSPMPCALNWKCNFIKEFIAVCVVLLSLCIKSSSTNFNMHHVIYLKFHWSIDSENCSDHARDNPKLDRHYATLSTSSTRNEHNEGKNRLHAVKCWENRGSQECENE